MNSISTVAQLKMSSTSFSCTKANIIRPQHKLWFGWARVYSLVW